MWADGGVQVAIVSIGRFVVEDLNKKRLETIDYKFMIAFSAIQRIMSGCGWVCEDFVNDCTHPVCHNSYKAWSIALQAIKDIEAVSNGDVSPLRTNYALWGKRDRQNPGGNVSSSSESDSDIPLSGGGSNIGPDSGNVPKS